MSRPEINLPNMKKLKLFITGILLIIVAGSTLAQLPEFTRIDTGAVFESTGAHYSGGWLDMDLFVLNSWEYMNPASALSKLYINKGAYFIKITNNKYSFIEKIIKN